MTNQNIPSPICCLDTFPGDVILAHVSILLVNNQLPKAVADVFLTRVSFPRYLHKYCEAS